MSTAHTFVEELCSSLQNNISELERANHRDEQLLRYLNYVIVDGDHTVAQSPAPAPGPAPALVPASTSTPALVPMAPSSSVSKAVKKSLDSAEQTDNQHDHFQAFVSTETSLPSKLDEILALARTTREKKTKSKTIEKSSGAAKEVIRGVSIGADSKKTERVSHMDQKATRGGLLNQRNVQDSESVVPPPTVSLRQHLSVQLAILKRIRKLTKTLLAPKVMDESDVWQHKQHFLTSVHGQPAVLRSHLFSALSQSLPMAVIDSTSSDQPLPKLIDVIRKAKDQYTQTLKGRLPGNATVARLAPEDIANMLSVWYKLHRCIDVYQAITKEGFATGTDGLVVDQDQLFANDIMASVATIAKPIPIPKDDALLLSRGWLEAENDNVEATHRILERCVSLLTETTIGKYELKDTLKCLRKCCEMTASGATTASNEPASSTTKDAWVASLKRFRAVYRCLAVDPPDSKGLNHSCVFMPTSLPPSPNH